MKLLCISTPEAIAMKLLCDSMSGSHSLMKLLMTACPREPFFNEAPCACVEMPNIEAMDFVIFAARASKSRPSAQNVPNDGYVACFDH